MTEETRPVASAETVEALQKQEGDVLYGFVLLFTYGQMFLILWDMLSMVNGFSTLAGYFGIQHSGRIHGFGEMTTLYLTLIGAYIGRNAWLKIKGATPAAGRKDDSAEMPHYLVFRMQRGYFYAALWGTICFVAYMLKGIGMISRPPYELTITTLGVFGLLFGDKMIKGYLDKRTLRQLVSADAASVGAIQIEKHADAVMHCVEQYGRITNAECRELTGLSPAQATRVLEQLEKEGWLEQKGDGRGVYYQKKG